MIAVVKVGGTAPGAAAQVAALAHAGQQVVVVHGAGPHITAGCIAAGVEPRFVDGQRVTDDSVMRVVEATIAEANAALCDQLAAEGIACRPARASAATCAAAPGAVPPTLTTAITSCSHY